MLLADMKNQDSNHDFGKDIIPTMLNDGRKLYAYKFKDIGKMSEQLIPCGKQIWI